MTITQAILANPNADDAAILAIVNAPVPQKIALPLVRQRLADSFEIVAIRRGKAHPVSQIADLCELADAFIYMPFDEDKVQLGGDHTKFLQLATALRDAGILSNDTLAFVNGLAFTIPTYTLADIALERSRAARDALAAEWSKVYNDGVDAIDAAWQAGETLPTLAELRAI
jgi:hypothetical protein